MDKKNKNNQNIEKIKLNIVGIDTEKISCTFDLHTQQNNDNNIEREKSTAT